MSQFIVQRNTLKSIFFYACICIRCPAVCWEVYLFVWSYISRVSRECKDCMNWWQGYNQTIFHILTMWCCILSVGFWVLRYTLKVLYLFMCYMSKRKRVMYIPCLEFCSTYTEINFRKLFVIRLFYRKIKHCRWLTLSIKWPVRWKFYIFLCVICQNEKGWCIYLVLNSVPLIPR